MSWLLLSLIVYSIILAWHLLLSHGVILPTGPLPIRIFFCLCVLILAVGASADFLVRYYPTLPDLTEAFWINADLLRTVGVLWLQFCAALVSCFLLLANGRDVTVVVHVK